MNSDDTKSESGVPELGSGPLRFIPNTEIDAAAKAAEDERIKQNTQPISTLAAHIETVFAANKQYKLDARIDEEMLENLRQRDGVYDDEKKAAIAAQGGTDVFVSLTGVKTAAAEAWICDILNSGMEKNWSLSCTPLPDLPDESQQIIADIAMRDWILSQQTDAPMNPDDVFKNAVEMRAKIEAALLEDAKLRAMRMELKISDQFEECGFADVFDDVISNVVTLKAGIVKGPLVRNHKGLSWKKERGGQSRPTVQTTLRTEYCSVSPFDMFPSPGAVDVQDGDLIEIVRFERKGLISMKGLPGWNSAAIDLVLAEYGAGGLREINQIDQERMVLEKKGQNLAAITTLIAGKEFWGSVQGQLLIDNGMTDDLKGNKIVPLMEYDIAAVKIGQYVVYAGINEDPLGQRPYAKHGYRKIPGSWWYKGVPELMRSLQQICNAAIRALVNNMGIASGPLMVIEDIGRLPPGEQIEQLTAWKIIQLVNKYNSTLPGIRFHDVPSHAPELMSIYNEFAKLADDYTGIPAYSYGNDNVAGAGRTSSGLSMLMNSASRGIKRVIYGVDRYIMRRVITMQFQHNMLYDPDESIKGDIVIKPIGTLGLIIKEQMSSKRLEFMQAVNNPIDVQIMGPEKRANLLRAAASGLDLPADEVVPSKSEMKAMVNKQSAAPVAPMEGAPVPPNQGAVA